MNVVCLKVVVFSFIVPFYYSACLNSELDLTISHKFLSLKAALAPGCVLYTKLLSSNLREKTKERERGMSDRLRDLEGK